MIGKHLPFGDNLKKVAIPTYFQSTLKISVSVMFWECIGPSSVGRLVKCHGQINAVKYIEILQDILHQSVKQMFGEKTRPSIFQHDNAPPHRAKKTKIYSKLHGIYVLPLILT